MSSEEAWIKENKAFRDKECLTCMPVIAEKKRRTLNGLKNALQYIEKNHRMPARLKFRVESELYNSELLWWHSAGRVCMPCTLGRNLMLVL